MKNIRYRIFSLTLLLSFFMYESTAAENLRIIREKITVKKIADTPFANLFNHPAWQSVRCSHFLCQTDNVEDIRRMPLEGAWIKMLYDNNYLYVLAEMTDSDILNRAEKSGGHLYADGDLLEVFIKTAEHPYYWEIYGTPNKLHTVFYYTKQGEEAHSLDLSKNKTPLLVESRISGTFNNAADKDKKFTLLLAIPRSELEKNNYKFSPRNKWLIMTGRYNYSRYLTKCEFSSYPQMVDDFHRSEYYAEIIFE